MEKHIVEIVKKGLKRSNPKKLELQIERIADRALSGGRKDRGWTVVTGGNKWLTPTYVNNEYQWTCHLEVECHKTRSQEVIAREFDKIVKFIATAGAQPGWQVVSIDGSAITKQDKRVPGPVGYVKVEIPSNWKESFHQIYDRESQIEIIMSCIQAGIDSEFQNRFHCALIGDPACGKTATLAAVKDAFGEDTVLEYDATATTQAGAIKDLDERDELPRILIVEEIEKTDPDSLRWLLGAMDQRAQIRKITARQQIQKETRFLTLATVNDYNLFEKIMYGALASRFTYHINFPRPDKKLLARILEREVIKIKGKRAWINPTLKYAEQNGIYDPRKVCAICLCGRDQLLTGEYQEKLIKCAVSKSN